MGVESDPDIVHQALVDGHDTHRYDDDISPKHCHRLVDNSKRAPKEPMYMTHGKAMIQKFRA